MKKFKIDKNFKPKYKYHFDYITKKATKQELKKLNVGVFAVENGKTLYLFPSDWYDFIPENYPIIDIFDKKKLFKKGKSDNDRRYGCLPYGFIREQNF